MNLENISLERLESRKSLLEQRKRDYEAEIVFIKSQIYCLYMRHLIKKASEEIHEIEVEICFRKVHQASANKNLGMAQ